MSSSFIPDTLASQSPLHCRVLFFPTELHINILTYLRADDFTSVTQTCRFWHSPQLTHQVIEETAVHVYSQELTHGFDETIVNHHNHKKQASSNQSPQETTTTPLLYTIHHLRHMELLVVARVLSRPEPPPGGTGFYVSKSWCKQALKWLELQQDTWKAPSQKKKLSKKQQRIRNRRLSDVSPPWPNVNADLVCSHQKLQRCVSVKASRARRKRLDKHAWKVLNKLYPDSNPLECAAGECVECYLEEESLKRQQADLVEAERLERKRPLSCPLVRGLYTRTRGVPLECLRSHPHGNGAPAETTRLAEACAPTCPLLPGQYHVLPRSWLYSWRRYLKTGEGGEPCAPCASLLLCDAHRLPLVPPHLEAYLRGETPTLLSPLCASVTQSLATEHVTTSLPVGMDPDAHTLQAMAAAGLSPAEVASQRMAMMRLEQQQQQRHYQQQQAHSPNNSTQLKDQLDRENSVVVELLTSAELAALEQWWPKAHSSYSLVVQVHKNGSFEWTTTPPCRECDATGGRRDLYVKNRARGWVKRKGQSRRPPASLEY